jgi:predicted DCC family thiol-disulfide oxidoreductase YuxK
VDRLKQDKTDLDVWMDGKCGLCQTSRAWCEARDPGKRVNFTDFRTAPDDQLPVNRDALENSMWVRSSDGTVLEGFHAWRRIMAALPGWRWIAAISGLPPIRWVGPHVYRFVARHRHRFPRQ